MLIYPDPRLRQLLLPRQKALLEPQRHIGKYPKQMSEEATNYSKFRKSVATHRKSSYANSKYDEPSGRSYMQKCWTLSWMWAKK